MQKHTTLVLCVISALLVGGSISLCSKYAATDDALATKNELLSKKITALEDTAAIKDLVDSFAILADQKEIQKLPLLFTEDAVEETTMSDQVLSSQHGREQIGTAYELALKNYDTVYHNNGQLTVTVEGDTASGVAYSTVTMIGTEDGKRTKTTLRIIAQDTYARINGKWLISQRKENYVSQEKDDVK